MPGLQDIPDTSKLRLEQLGTADLAIGLTGDEKLHVADNLHAVAAAIHEVPAAGKAVVFHSGSAGIESTERVSFIAVPPAGADAIRSALTQPLSAYRAMLEAADGLQCRAFAALSSDPAHLSPAEIRALTEPVLTASADLVVAHYSERKHDALMNRSIVYPLTRALYGKRVRFPLAGDFAVSAKLGGVLQAVAATHHGGASRLLTAEAIRRDFDIAQAAFRLRHASAAEVAADPSTVLTSVAGSLFLDAERNAAFWQRTRGSRPVPIIGTPVPPPIEEEEAPAQVDGLLETFRLAYRNLMDVWSLLLPPGTLVELRKLTAARAEDFRMPDRIWARIVYDFTLGYRMRVISRDHVLGAMTPLYLAWVASHVLELRTATPEDVLQRVERLSAAYEAEKPYLISRWRWPDRFNP